MSVEIFSRTRTEFEAHLKARGWVPSLYNEDKWITLNLLSCYWEFDEYWATLVSTDEEIGAFMVVHFTGAEV